MVAMRQRGFTYLGLIILVAIIGLVGAATLKVGSLLQRAAAEEELLETGAAFSEALKSYAAATPLGQPRQPKTLQDLLRDPRYPNVRRHLRKIFVDPITGKAEWGVMYLGDKVGVIGVYSLSNAKPLKIANFDARFTNLENKQRFSEWKFMLPGQAATLLPSQRPGVAPSLFKVPPGLGQVQAVQVTGAAAGAPGPGPAPELIRGQSPEQAVPQDPPPVPQAEPDNAAPEPAPEIQAPADPAPEPTDPVPDPALAPAQAQPSESGADMARTVQKRP